MPNVIPLSEIFGPTIQGEGIHVGALVDFLRVAGCSYQCNWCDTDYAQDAANQLLAYHPSRLARYYISQQTCVPKDIPLVLTGGDPAMYDFTEFIKTLLDAYPYKQIWVETQGAFCPDWFSMVDHVAVSPKLSASGMLEHTKIDFPKFMDRMQLLPRGDEISGEIKFVIQDLCEIDETLPLLEANYYLNWPVVYQPCASEIDTPATLLRKVESLIQHVQLYESRYSIYVLPQMHRLLWGTKRGV